MLVLVVIAFSIVLAAFAGAIATEFMKGRIRLDGLLLDKQLGGLSQGRVQLLVTTISLAVMYLIKTITAAHAGSVNLPDIQQPFILTAYGKLTSVARVLLKVLRGIPK